MLRYRRETEAEAVLLSGDTKQVLHCWRLLESSEHHPQDKQENHPTQETAGGLDSHPSGPSIQGTFLLEKESIAKNSHPTHVNSYFLFFFFYSEFFPTLFPLHSGKGWREAVSCSHLVHAFAFPAAFLQKAGLYPQQATGARLGAEVGVILLRNTTGAHTQGTCEF